MYVTVFGLGRTGTVTAAMLAHLGHKVYGVDVDLDKLALLRLGRIPFYEPNLGEYVRDALDKGRLTITTDGTDSIHYSDLSLVCVGTPSNNDGSTDMSAIYAALETIGVGLQKREAYHTVVLRSTVPIPELDKLILHLEVKSRREVGRDVGFCVNPEFLREGSAVADFLTPPFIIIGQDDQRAGNQLRTLYEALETTCVTTDYRTAMLVKYVSNAWHALKVVFANEVGQIASSLTISADEVMGIITRDTTLNISSAYMQPGGPYGGSCLPKDLAALLRMTEADLPVLASIPLSNGLHIMEITRRILTSGAQRIGMVGLSFKRNTDDLRGSPWVTIVDALLDAQREVRIYDPDVSRVMAGAYRDLMVYEFEELKAWAEYIHYAKPNLIPNLDATERDDE